MAKGNLILGTAGNSIGDVVMYRRDGAQVSRVRVRKVANPRTNAQSAQRSFFAPVAKFFSPLSSVLERSWEGLNKSKSYSKFLAENVKLARKNGWLLPKGTGFFPLPYQLSNGTLPVVGYYYDDTYVFLGVPSPSSTAVAGSIGQISSSFVAAGYKNGDIVTIIAVYHTADIDNHIPVSFQFAIDDTSTVLFSTILPTNIGLSLEDETTWRISEDNDRLDAAAVIVARFEDNKWRRSKQVLAVNGDILDAVTSPAAKAAAIASYGNAATGENPLVYLDGDELQD